MIFTCPRSRLKIWPRVTDSAVPSRVSLLISILGLNLVLTSGISTDFREGVHVTAADSLQNAYLLPSMSSYFLDAPVSRKLQIIIRICKCHRADGSTLRYHRRQRFFDLPCLTNLPRVRRFPKVEISTFWGAAALFLLRHAFCFRFFYFSRYPIFCTLYFQVFC